MLKLECRARRELRSRKQSIELGQPVVPARDALGASEEDMRKFFIAVDLTLQSPTGESHSARSSKEQQIGKRIPNREWWRLFPLYSALCDAIG